MIRSRGIIEGLCFFVASLFVRAAYTAPPPEQAEIFDVVLLVDRAPETEKLADRAAAVVVEAMGDAHRLGVVAFAEDAAIVRQLNRISTVEVRADFLMTFAKIEFDGVSRDLGSGLELALAHLNEKGRDDAMKVVLLLSDGRFLSPADGGGIPLSKGQIKGKILPDFLAKGVILHIVAVGDARLDFLQISANITGGKCLAAPNIAAMTDALDVLIEGLRPPEKMVVSRVVPSAASSPAKKPAPNRRAPGKAAREHWSLSSGFLLAIAVLVVLIVLLNFAVIAILLLRRGRRSEGGLDHAEPSDRVGKRLGFAELRDLSNHLSNKLVDAGELVETLNLDLEDFGVAGWKREKILTEKYRDFARGVFLLLDHLELKEDDGSDARWFQEKLKRVLEDEGIREIAVKKGEQFDGMYHRHVGEQNAGFSDGAIVELKRKGYVKDALAAEEGAVVLRQAEVVVSRGVAPRTDNR